MLRGLRKASANWLGRTVMGVVMGLLAVSFAVWGINDIFRGFGRSTLAKIGRTEIPIELFRRTYNERLQQIGQKLGHPLPPEQASALGLDRQVLSEMLVEAGLDQRARQMRLGISDAEIVRRITADPNFQTPTGQFDRLRFELLLRNAGYSEQRFVAEQRGVMLRRQIIGSISGDIPAPKAWFDAINQFQNEERSIEYLALGPAQAGEIPQPTAEELNKYFEARKILFRAPEYRKIVTVQVTPAELARWMEISDADVKRAFDEHRSRYITPERRHVEQIVFPTMAEAEAAEARIKDGLSFAALAAERGLKEHDIDLGTVAKTAIIDPAVADAAFSLKEGEVSAPVKGRFGGVIVTVPKIEPEATQSFADVAPQIRADIAAERAKAEVRSLHDKMEDQRAGGSTLEEAAQKAQLPIVTYEAVDRSGRDPQGKLVGNLPHAGDMISVAFASEVGVDNEPIEADGGYIWYEVAGITPSHDRTLDEVRSEVEARWREDEIASRLKAKATDLLDKLKSGNPLDAIAKANNLNVEAADKLKRSQATADMSAKTIAAVFHTANGAFGSAAGDKPGQWIVFRVANVTTPKLDANSPEAKQLAEAVQRQLADEIFGEYMAWLEDDLGTSINRAALAQALGASAPDTN
ncbi:MAG TPA: peptidyl-prolyl cis-trans isomerase [Xanthobacteraceae bacterium]|nr:peptidyl-prolyl cis-trans isomerase [Xanthobacteraceae bacterium]